jgi:hypothetical protein
MTLIRMSQVLNKIQPRCQPEPTKDAAPSLQRRETARMGTTPVIENSEPNFRKAKAGVFQMTLERR